MRPGSDSRSGARGSRAVPALILALYVVVALVATWPLSGRPAQALPANADALAFAWAIAWVCHALPSDPLHLLHANIYFPDRAALAYGEPMVSEALLALPIYALTRNDVLTFNVLLVLTLSLTAFFMFLLAREITGDVAASVLAGEIFAFTTANYDSVARIQIVSSQWTPLALFFLVRLLRGRRLRDGLGFGAAFALQGLACNYYKLFFATLLALTLPLFLLLVPHPRRRNTPWMPLLVAGGLALALFLPLDVAQYRHLQRISTARTRLEGAQLGTSYLQAMPENWWYGARLGKLGVSYDDRFFLGIIPPVLAAAGLALAWPSLRRRLGLSLPESNGQAWVPPFLTFGALAFLLGCGGEIVLPWGHVPGPLRLLQQYVPGYALTRVPSRFVMFVRLAVALFAAFGVSVLASGARWPRGARALAMAPMLVLLPLEHQSTPLPTWSISSGARVPGVYRWLAEQPEDAPLLEFPPHPLRSRREESWWMHFSTYHWRPIVNGFGSYYPLFHNFVNELILEDFPGLRSLRVLKAMGVRYVVFHPQLRGSPEADAAALRFERRVDRYPELQLVKAFDDPPRFEGHNIPLGPARVYRLAAPGYPRVRRTDGWSRLPRDRWRCESQPPDADCRFALDGDLDTAFGNPAAKQQPGDFLRLLFPRALAVRGVSLVCGRMAADYPRQVEIRGLLHGSWVLLPHRFDEVEFLEEMQTRPREASMDLVFQPVQADGLEVRLAIDGQGFSAWRLPEIHVYDAAGRDWTRDAPND